MLDRDLAELYGVTTGQLNRQVNRNIKRFPSDFMFQLTKEDCLRCQIGILNGGRGLRASPTNRRADYAKGVLRRGDVILYPERDNFGIDKGVCYIIDPNGQMMLLEAWD